MPNVGYALQGHGFHRFLSCGSLAGKEKMVARKIALDNAYVQSRS